MADDYFKGKIAFVTGAATKMGMGRAIALRLAAAGANVAILDKYRETEDQLSRRPRDGGGWKRNLKR